MWDWNNKMIGSSLISEAWNSTTDITFRILYGAVWTLKWWRTEKSKAQPPGKPENWTEIESTQQFFQSHFSVGIFEIVKCVQ